MASEIVYPFYGTHVVSLKLATPCNFFSVLLKKTAICILIFSFLAQTLNTYSAIFDYYLHTSIYMQKCINKDKPLMHCNGKCQLSKKIIQQENSEKQNQERRSGNNNISSLSSESWFTSNGPVPFVFGISVVHIEHSSGKTIKMPTFFFHPPGNCMA